MSPLLHIDTGAISRIKTDVNAMDGLAAVCRFGSMRFIS